MARRILQRSFYERDTITVARELLGQHLVHGRCVGRIVEVEAYVREYEGQLDRAAHASRGLTPRTRVLFGPGGFAYVYLIYGVHECLNVTAEGRGIPGCVLVRALEPVSGFDIDGEERSCSGPGKLTRAMGITRAHYGADLTRAPLTVHEGTRTEPITAGPRIGISHCADWPLRFYLADNRFVSRSPSKPNKRNPQVG
jgi:DNA-3-methyladenine glycosylase